MLLRQVRRWNPLHETPIKFEMFSFFPGEGSKVFFFHRRVEHSGTMCAEIGIIRVKDLIVMRRGKSSVGVEPTRYGAGSGEDADGHRYRLDIQPKAKGTVALLREKMVWSSGSFRSYLSFPGQPCLPHLRRGGPNTMCRQYAVGYHLQQARKMAATHPTKLVGRLLRAALSSVAVRPTPPASRGACR